MPRYGAIEKKVISALRGLENGLRGLPPKDGNWGERVIKGMAAVAPTLGYAACGRWCDSPAFMYDLAWLKRKPNGEIANAVLVAECEWGNDYHVLYDFRKLLLARAEHRALIFTRKTRMESSALMQKMREEIQRFRQTQPGDRYLFACWEWPPDRKEGFRFTPYIVEP